MASYSLKQAFAETVFVCLSGKDETPQSMWFPRITEYKDFREIGKSLEQNIKFGHVL